MLFSCSIRDNIAYGAVDPDAVTTEDVYRAAKVANAFDFVQSFPKGFDTVVGEKGVLLSGKALRWKKNRWSSQRSAYFCRTEAAEDICLLSHIL